MVVNSLITSHVDGARVPADQPVSVDGHRLGWRLCHQQRGGVERRRQDLGLSDIGSRSRPLCIPHLELQFLTGRAGKRTVMARASNKIGQTQTTELIQNPPGYHHNIVHSVTFDVV